MTRGPARRSGRRPAGHGFTLIEVTIALAASIAVLSITMGLMVQTLRAGKRNRAVTDLARQGTFVQQILSQDLRLAGMGVPRSQHISFPGRRFDTYVITATQTEVGIVGDLARPDASYGSFGFLHDRPTGSSTLLAWHTENNGSCVRNSLLDCDIGAASTFFRENGCNADAADRVCPWGMKRAVANEPLQVASGSGDWADARVGTTLTIGSTATGVRGLQLQSGWDPTIWPMLGPPLSANVTPPLTELGQGWVTSLDRVFYRFDAAQRALLRVQCWGPPDPQHASWPPLATASTAMPGAVPQNQCTPPEVVATNVESVTFTYFDGAGAQVIQPITGAAKVRVRRIDLRIQLRATVDGKIVDHVVTGAVGIRALQ